MKIKIESILQAALVFSVLAVFTAIAGCNRTPQSIENKAQIVTRLAVQKVLQKHPDALPKIQIARDELLVIENAETINVESVLEIIQRLPPDTFSDPNNGAYVEAGVLFFSDELGALGAKDPEQVRSAARGMRRALDTFIPKQ